MEFPFTCPLCNTVNMVDTDNLPEQFVDKIRNAAGYKCENCGNFTRLFYMTISLRESFQKLKRYNHLHPDFPFHFAKTLKKALSTQGK